MGGNEYDKITVCRLGSDEDSKNSCVCSEVVNRQTRREWRVAFQPAERKNQAKAIHRRRRLGRALGSLHLSSGCSSAGSGFRTASQFASWHFSWCRAVANLMEF
jgi:hypothetical protein